MRVLIIGGGLAGVETALTLSKGIEDACEVSILTPIDSLRVLPNLVYVPVGTNASISELSISQSLRPHGVNVHLGQASHVERKDDGSYLVETEEEKIYEADVVILALGASPMETNGMRLRTIEDAHHLREALHGLPKGQKQEIMIRILDEGDWSAPAYELAFLLERFLREKGLASHTNVCIETSELTPCGLFGYDASEVVRKKIEDSGIILLSAMPPHRIEALEGDITIDFGYLVGQSIGGIPLGSNRFYKPDKNGMLMPSLYVVGDAADSPYKGAFATSVQARRILSSLGGKVEKLGTVDGIPHTESEYQLDMADETMVVRFKTPESLFNEMARKPEVSVRVGAPKKLSGTLVRELVFPS